MRLHGLAVLECGQSLVEVALLLPFMVYLLVGGADLARAYAVQLAVQNGARAGAEATVLDFTPTVGEAQSYAIQEMSRTPGMNSASAVITMTKLQANGSQCPATPDPTTPCFVTVRVRYQFRTIIPWPLIPNTFNFDRSTVMRTYL
ncbi:MAG TPA: TadE/TadG family type IV pilus assembly protein [Candidatus Limnocylindria bacterium]|nr:TadE/TadG family type IV pilus assembly protein [Candidatus Limnocylindria bacterium]